MKKQIKDFEDYYVDEQGRVYSYKWNREHEIKPWKDSRDLYLMVSLCKNNQKTNKLVHRLVAEAFIPNPENLPEIDHINRNPKDNRVENLRWCSHKFNLEQSYQTMSPVRNYRITELIIGDKHIGYFKSTTLACQYAQLKGYSKSSLEKYKHCKDAKIIQRDVTTIENEEDFKIIESLTEVE